MTRSVLYSTENYRVTRHPVAASAVTIVIFDFWTERPSLDDEPPGERFFVQQGLNVIGVKTARNDWYQGNEMAEVCACVVAATPGQRRVGYGGSMGGYAAINFAQDLDLHDVIAICPQFSIDRVKAPFERRWRAEAGEIDFKLDRMDRRRSDRPARGHLVFDPHTVDGLHAERILAHHDLVPVRIRHGGHDQMLLLQQCDMLSGMLLDMVHGRFRAADCLATLRQRRRGSAVFWLNLARTLARHGRHDAAHRALREARACGGAPAFRWQFHAALTDCLLAPLHGR